MKKLLFLSAFLCALISCDFKDKNGNAPLIEDSNGRLIDNPNYVSDEEFAKQEKEKKWDEDVKHIHESMEMYGDSVTEANKNKVYTKEELKEKEEQRKQIERNFNLK